MNFIEQLRNSANPENSSSGAGWPAYSDGASKSPSSRSAASATRCEADRTAPPSGVVAASPLSAAHRHRRRGRADPQCTSFTARLLRSAMVADDYEPSAPVTGQPLAPAAVEWEQLHDALPPSWARRAWWAWRWPASTWRCGNAGAQPAAVCAAGLPQSFRCAPMAALALDGTEGLGAGGRGLSPAGAVSRASGAKIGYPSLAEDLAVIRAIRAATGPAM